MKVSALGLASACLLLAFSIVLAFPVVGYLAFVKFGLVGVVAAAVAAGVCWTAATLALVVTGILKQSASAVGGVLLASGLRFVLPLAAGAVLQTAGGALGRAGVFGWIVVFYLITLTVETTLGVLVLRNRTRESAKAS